jgi:hypothetical protein
VSLGVLPTWDVYEHDIAEVMNNKYGANFVHYCEDNTIASLADIDPQQLRLCIQRIDKYLYQVQPVVVYVGVNA